MTVDAFVSLHRNRLAEFQTWWQEHPTSEEWPAELGEGDWWEMYENFEPLNDDGTA